MTQRLTTILETFTGSSWQPAVDTILQLKGGITNQTVVDVQARVDTSADWLNVGSLTPADPVARFARMPYMQLVARGNPAGSTLTVWDNE